MPALTPYSMGLAPLAPAPGAVEASLPALCHTQLADDFAGARIQYARCEPRQVSGTSAATCQPFLPMQAPVEVRVLGTTEMHLHSEHDRVAFLDRNRPSALWVELLDAVRPVDGCPKTLPASEVPSEIAGRMSCLGLGNRSGQASDTRTSPPPEASANSGQTLHTAGKDNASEFPTAQRLALPSTYLSQELYAPGTMAALEYDLGWRALAPSWQALMPEIDETSWRANPNPELFRAVGRAVLPHLMTDAQGLLMDHATVRIVSFHMHAGGLTDCLANVTRAVERTDADGQPSSVAAIELMDFVRGCAGPKWREALVAAPGQDALTRRREACEAQDADAPTPSSTTPAEVTLTGAVDHNDAPDEPADSPAVGRLKHLFRR